MKTNKMKSLFDICRQIERIRAAASNGNNRRYFDALEIAVKYVCNIANLRGVCLPDMLIDSKDVRCITEYICRYSLYSENGATKFKFEDYAAF